VGDPKTLIPAAEKARKDFGVSDIVLVGDRGIISQKQIDELKETGGIDWITGLKTGAISKLVKHGSLHLGRKCNKFCVWAWGKIEKSQCNDRPHFAGSWMKLRVVYEARLTGLGICRSLNEWGAQCAVIAPTLIPKQNADRVKTDRRDARKLAHLSFGGRLTAIYIPSDEQEALRDLVRARQAAKNNQTSIFLQLSNFSLRRNLKPNSKIKKMERRIYAMGS